MTNAIVEDLIVFNCVSSHIDIKNKCIHFLTHVGRHHSILTDIVADHVKTIYTSEFNSWYLSTFFGAEVKRFVGVPVNRKINLTKNGRAVTFEFIDANHCPGAVMVLVKGDFGTFLHTGNYRFHQNLLKHPSLKPYCHGEKKLDRLYINLAFKKLGHNFPSREEVVKDVINFIKDHKKENIYICTRLLGKEDILAKIAKQLKLKIFVDKHKMKVLHQLGYSRKLFTLEIRESRLRVVDLKEVTWFKMKKRRQQENCVAVVLSAWDFNKEKLKRYGIHVFPASDHSSCEETKLMLSSIKAKEIVFINCKNNANNNEKIKVSTNKELFNCQDSFEKWWSRNVSAKLDKGTNCESTSSESSDESLPIVRFNIKSPLERNKNLDEEPTGGLAAKDAMIPGLVNNNGPAVIVETVEVIEESPMSCNSDNSSRISFRLSRSDDEDSRCEQMEVEPNDNNSSDSSIFSYLTSESTKKSLSIKLKELRESQTQKPTNNASSESVVDPTQSQNNKKDVNPQTVDALSVKTNHQIEKSLSKVSSVGSSLNISPIRSPEPSKTVPNEASSLNISSICSSETSSSSKKVPDEASSWNISSICSPSSSKKVPDEASSLNISPICPPRSSSKKVPGEASSLNISSICPPESSSSKKVPGEASSWNISSICSPSSSLSKRVPNEASSLNISPICPPESSLSKKVPDETSSVAQKALSHGTTSATTSCGRQGVASSQRSTQISQNSSSSQKVCSQTVVYPFNQALYDLFRKNCPSLFK